MRLSRDFMLERARARDARYDGRFVTGVLSTGIYCLPSCRARAPREENVRFFEAPSDARAAGLRPCMRCRPDERWAGRNPELERLDAAVAEVRRDPAGVPDVATLAAHAGLGVTRLRELARSRWQATPAGLLQEARLAEARRRLLAGEAVLDVAGAVGYESASAFHAAFRVSAALTPAAYRRLPGSDAFRLALPPAYPAARVLRFLGRDPASPSERVAGATVVRALVLGGGPARLSIALADGVADCRLEGQARLPAAAAVEAHAAAVRLLGLGRSTAALERRLLSVPGAGTLADGLAGLPVLRTPSVLEALVWAVLGQQVNLAFAFALRRSLLELCGAPAGGGLYAHPDTAVLARLEPADLVRLRLSRRKAEALSTLARRAASGELDLESMPDRPAADVERALLAERGIGPWSAAYVMMRGCGFPDCVPAGDTGLATALARVLGLTARPDAAAAARLMEPFAPHRSLAVFRLWATLGAAA